MQYFPIFVDGQKLNVLVVGGGEVATRKVELMLKTPAQVTVVSPKLSSTLIRLHQQGKINYVATCYDKALLTDKQLVFVATANRQLNRQISLDARAAGVLANVVDDPELCHFITPSIIDRAPMIFAISSGGKSPVQVRYWRARLETLIPQALGQIATFAGGKRHQIKQHLDNVTKRRNFWELFFSSSRSDDPEQLEPLFQELVTAVDTSAPIKGELYVVETPSNPEFLSLVALRHMQQADIAIYDKGVSGAVIELVRRDADRESVDGDAQQQLEQLLAQGLRVCYLSSHSHQNQAALWQQFQQSEYTFKTFACAKEVIAV